LPTSSIASRHSLGTAAFGKIKRDLLCRRGPSSDTKAEGHFAAATSKAATGDAANVFLSDVGHKLRRIFAWLREFSIVFLVLLWQTLVCPTALNCLLWR
jgi:IS5 family transposase